MSENPLWTIVHIDTETELDASARAAALSWAPNTRKSYLTGWQDFTKWCIENRCPGLPANPADVGHYIEHLVELQGKSLATARSRLSAIAAAHRLGRHPNPASDPLVQATLKRMAREYGKARKQARGLTAEAPWRPSRRWREPSGFIWASAGVRKPSSKLLSVLPST